ncbi:MAG TPA: DUF3604 domain-containing protein [Myxococcota bacterium]|jgi:hypothetical protein
MGSRPTLWFWLAAALGSPAAAGDAPPAFRVTEAREPCAARSPLRSPFFGDLHVHTSFSQDASTQGTRNGPREAYRFARGEALGIQPYDDQGRALRRLKLARPLDFAAVTDHAELIGEVEICRTPELPGYRSIPCWIYRNYPRAAFFIMNTKSSMHDPTRFGFCGEGGRRCLEAARIPWQEIQDAAEGAYDRSSACRFTSFVGYEWTGSVDTNNLHRNVIFRNQRVPELPTSFYEASSAEALWKSLREGCLARGDGCDVIAIPHNSNLSNGLIFQTVGQGGLPITVEEARTRAELERLVEVMQHKGDSECRLSPDTTDELCGFEKLPYANFGQKFFPYFAKQPARLSFVRETLGVGLAEEARLGVNPFKYGLIASTDTHLGTPGAVDEASHPGHGGAGAPAARELPKGLPDDFEFNPGGLAVIWAEENSRDSLFEAMRRREVYGTSGPRHVVRFFGGWRLPADLCAQESFAASGYASGVPMGGDLPARTGDRPSFAVSALRDPGTEQSPGVALQRVQIVKGWLENGVSRERVYEVAGDPHNGASVDLKSCIPEGSGSDSLCSVWRDPDFDASQRAFYYARVVENPSCRWSTIVCNEKGVDCSDPASVPEELAVCCEPGRAKTVQERSWTSPIWYAPDPAGGAPR